MVRRSPLADLWPLYNLVVRTPRLELRYPSDDDLATLADLPNEGIHDPERQPFNLAWTELPSPQRERSSLQWWRQAEATWSSGEWRLNLAVVVDDEVIGVQDMRAKDFLALRAVSTGSWIVRRLHGSGIGAEMRAAVLDLAFHGLGALEAHSSAFEWNRASIRVSEKLGYERNGEELALRGEERDRALCFRLSRDAWAANRRDDIELVGLGECLELFGLGPDLEPLSRATRPAR